MDKDSLKRILNLERALSRRSCWFYFPRIKVDLNVFLSFYAKALNYVPIFMLDVIGLVIYSSSKSITGHPFPFPKAGLYYGGIDVSSLSSNVHYC